MEYTDPLERLKELRLMRKLAMGMGKVLDQDIAELERRQDDKTDAKIEHHRQVDHGITPTSMPNVLGLVETMSQEETVLAFKLEQDGLTLEEIATAIGKSRYVVQMAMAQAAAEYQRTIRDLSGPH